MADSAGINVRVDDLIVRTATAQIIELENERTHLRAQLAAVGPVVAAAQALVEVRDPEVGFCCGQHAGDAEEAAWDRPASAVREMGDQR